MEQREDKEISISMKGDYWAIILALLEPVIKDHNDKIKELRDSKTDPNSIPEHVTTALIGPLLIRGIIIKALVAEGVMRQEAADQAGIDVILQKASEIMSREKQ